MSSLREISASTLGSDLCVPVAFLCLVAAATPAFAYRPFDGTDAAVADPGQMEVEFQPAGSLHDESGTTLVAPGTRLNFGVTEGWEAVLEGLRQMPLSPDSGPSSLAAAGAFLKGVIRPGVLQDKTGPSVATEFGVLLPDSIGETTFGASAAWIVSQRWDWGSIHLNAAAALTRAHHGDIFVGTIIEGPAKWTARPVAEVFYEKEFTRFETISGLVGLIWQINEDVAFDLAVRHAITNGHPVDELRAGLTFGFPLWRSGGTWH
jgi:hypothetical protein